MLAVQRDPPSDATPDRGRRELWTRANLKEVLPELPSPFAASLLETFTGPQMLAAFESPGYRFPQGAILFRTFAGRPYFNLGLLHGLLTDLGLPAEMLDQAVGRGRALRRSRRGWNWRLIGRRLPTVLHSLYRQARAATEVERWLGQVEALIAEMSLQSGRVLRTQPDVVLLETMDRASVEIAQFVRHTSYLAAAANVDLYELERAITGRASAPGALINQAVVGSGNISAALPLALMRVGAAARIEDNAQRYFGTAAGSWPDFRDALRGTRTLHLFERVLDRFGHRAIFESDEANPRFAEAPDYLLGVIAQYVRTRTAPDPEQVVARQRAAAQAARVAIKRLAGWRWPEVGWRLDRVRPLLALREANRFQAMRLVALLRWRDLEMARRLVERGWLDGREDYFWLTAVELDRVLRPGGDDQSRRLATGVRLGLVPRSLGVAPPDELASDSVRLRSAIAARRARYARYAAVTVPDEPDDPTALEQFARGAGPPPPGATPHPPPVLSGFGAGDIPSPAPDAGPAGTSTGEASLVGAVLRGIGVSVGQARGPARVIRHPGEFGRLREGDILVCPATDPAWSPLFPLVAGLVVEIGGQLSHGSIVAREYGIPAVVNVPQATILISDGALIEIDAARGTVHLLDGDAG